MKTAATSILAGLTALALVVGVAGAVAACSGGPPAATDLCGQAKNQFASCGTSLPLFTDGPCSGTTRIVARCVVDHAHDCDELATLFSRIDECVADTLDGGDSLLPPATDLPVTSRDSGVTDAGEGAEAAPPHDAGDASDDGPSLDSGATDSGPVNVTGLDVTGTVALSEEKRFQTPLLAAGTYTFAMTGTGDADLYVRKTTAPTLSTYDCRPFEDGSNETCTVTLATPAIVHVMIRGEAATSTFTLEGQP